MIYWWGINIGDRSFYEEIANIKSANLNMLNGTWHKFASIKSANFFPQTNPPNITPTNNHLVRYRIAGNLQRA